MPKAIQYNKIFHQYQIPIVEGNEAFAEGGGIVKFGDNAVDEIAYEDIPDQAEQNDQQEKKLQGANLPFIREC